MGRASRIPLEESWSAGSHTDLDRCRGKLCSVCDGATVLIPMQNAKLISHSRIAVADSTGRLGYVTSKGVCFFPVQYEHTLDILVEYAGICISSRTLFVDVQGRLFPLLRPKDADDRSNAHLTAHRHGNAWMLRSDTGALVTEFHDVQAYFHEGRALLKTSRGWEYLDPTGCTVCAMDSGQASHYKNGRARFLKGRKWGYADLKGKVMIKPQFDSAWNFSEGLAAVKWNEWWGYINEAGDVAVDGRFGDARDFSCGLARTSLNRAFAIKHNSSGRRLELQGNYGFINRSGEFTIPPIYRAAKDFSEDLAAVRFGTKWGYINTTGHLAIPASYSWVSSFTDGLACVSRNRRYGYINRTGNKVIDLWYSKAFDFSEGLAAVRKNDAWGFIDAGGSWVIKPVFEDVSPFRGGLARAACSGKVGYIDRVGNWVIPPVYNSATSFSDGLALVQQGKIRCFIDRNGKTAFVVP